MFERQIPKDDSNSKFSLKGLTTPKICDVRLYIGNYEYVNVSSYAVLGKKLWLEDGDLDINYPLHSFKFIQSKAQN